MNFEISVWSVCLSMTVLQWIAKLCCPVVFYVRVLHMINIDLQNFNLQQFLEYISISFRNLHSSKCSKLFIFFTCSIGVKNSWSMSANCNCHLKIPIVSPHGAPVLDSIELTLPNVFGWYLGAGFDFAWSEKAVFFLRGDDSSTASLSKSWQSLLIFFYTQNDCCKR